MCLGELGDELDLIYKNIIETLGLPADKLSVTTWHLDQVVLDSGNPNRYSVEQDRPELRSEPFVDIWDLRRLLSSHPRKQQWPITLLSFDLRKNYYIKNVALFEDNSILLLPERLESSGW